MTVYSLDCSSGQSLLSLRPNEVTQLKTNTQGDETSTLLTNYSHTSHNPHTSIKLRFSWPFLVSMKDLPFQCTQVTLPKCSCRGCLSPPVPIEHLQGALRGRWHILRTRELLFLGGSLRTEARQHGKRGHPSLRLKN